MKFLSLWQKVRKNSFVTSYVQPGMLTHDLDEQERYERDPLISPRVSVGVLVGMHDTARRVVHDAAAIRTPAMVLIAGKDYVVKARSQRLFFERLSSPVKEIRTYDGMFHGIWHERDREWPIAHAREFLLRAFERPVEDAVPASNEAQYQRLAKRPAASSTSGAYWGVQRAFLKLGGNFSAGIGVGWRYGFDSGDSLDYVYRNRPEGFSPLGRLIDRIYLNSPGWRGIRQRKIHLETILQKAVAAVRREGQPLHIFDPAAGAGRYVLETVSALRDPAVRVTLRDWSQSNVDAASDLAARLQIPGVTVARGDAFHRDSLASLQPRPGIVLVSGLYELFADNARVRESLLGIADALGDDGYLIFTNQPWHPQLEMIARVLDNRDGQPWVMRCRSQAEMDALVRVAGFEKQDMLVDEDGIFTVSLARRTAANVSRRRAAC
jgi:hypothetical protein